MTRSAKASAGPCPHCCDTGLVADWVGDSFQFRRCICAAAASPFLEHWVGRVIHPDDFVMVR